MNQERERTKDRKSERTEVPSLSSFVLSFSRSVVFPIRHHSPASALLLERTIEEFRPRRILIEGPSDGDGLIPALVDAGTVPPVAILAWRPDGPNAIYPFLRCSPELVALRAAARLGIPARFIDIPASVALDHPGREAASADLEAEICARMGFDSYEEFWEAAFESGTMDLGLFLEYARLMRAEPGRTTAFDRAREAFLAREIAREPAEGTLVVCGAFHAAALEDGDVDLSLAPAPAAPAELAVVPYSYPRLSEASGYGAGNRAPRFYERVYEAGGDLRRAAHGTLLELAKRTGASLAETIDACRLAGTLASVRGKPGPGLDEVRSAARACLLEGRDSDAVRDATVGLDTGRVRISRSPLADEFHATTRRLGLPVEDRAKEVTVLDRETAVFLHRVRVAEVPYGTLLQRNRWRLRWAPATDAAILRRTELGATFAEVARRYLLARDPRSAAEAAVLVRDAAAADVGVLPHAVAACERLSREDGDLRSLATAAHELRDFEDLFSRLFARALLLAPQAARAADAGVPAVESAFRTLLELGGSFRETLRQIARDPAANPWLSGFALGLVRGTDLAVRLSAGETARFFGGYVAAQRSTIGRDAAVLGAVDRWVDSLETPRFLEILPLLRRAFSGVKAAEVLRTLRAIPAPREGLESEIASGTGVADARAFAGRFRAAEREELARWTPLRVASARPARTLEELRNDCFDPAKAFFAVLELRSIPEALSIVETTADAVAGRAFVELCRLRPDSDGALRRLAAGPPPVCHLAADALAERSDALRLAHARAKAARRELHDDLVRTALWARRASARAEAVAALGRTRDPLFADVLRRAADDRDAAVRREAAVALASVGDLSRLEEWPADSRARTILRGGAP